MPGSFTTPFTIWPHAWFIHYTIHYLTPCLVHSLHYSLFDPMPGSFTTLFTIWPMPGSFTTPFTIWPHAWFIHYTIHYLTPCLVHSLHHSLFDPMPGSFTTLFTIWPHAWFIHYTGLKTRNKFNTREMNKAVIKNSLHCMKKMVSLLTGSFICMNGIMFISMHQVLNVNKCRYRRISIGRHHFCITGNEWRCTEVQKSRCILNCYLGIHVTSCLEQKMIISHRQKHSTEKEENLFD